MLWILVLLLPVLVIITFRSYFSISYFTNLASDRALFRVAQAVASQIHIDQNTTLIAYQMQKTIELMQFEGKDKIFYKILDQNQKLIDGDQRLNLPKKLPKIGKKFFYDGTLGQQKIRLVAFQYPLDKNETSNFATIIVAETLNHRNAMQEDILAVFILTQVVIVILVVLAVNLAIKKGLNSLAQLRTMIANREPNDISALDNQNSPFELRPLVISMNELLVKIRASVDEKQQFIANAAHQIKTPLAGLKLQLESAIREKEPQQIKHALTQASIGVNNLDRLTKQLLSLARAELTFEEYRANRFSKINLYQLAQDVCAEWVPVALKKGIEIEVLTQGENLMIDGDEILLSELLNNLVDNAIHYNKAGTKVIINIFEDESHLTLSVEDNGIGIPEALQKNVWQRFYRVLGNHADGCGLGLSIVQEIAKKHSATLTLNYSDSTNKTGTIVKVSFTRVPSIFS
jgi:two-component system sensor histidine kinase TctE